MGTEATSYDAVAHELLADPAVVTGKLFGHPCLKIGGRALGPYQLLLGALKV